MKDGGALRGSVKDSGKVLALGEIFFIKGYNSMIFSVQI